MKRETVFQVIDTNGNVIYFNTYLWKCKRWAKKHFTFADLSGKGSYVEIEEKTTPQRDSFDFYKDYFPEFKSRSNGLFRRYVIQTTVVPKSPEAVIYSQCVAYIINSFHENHINYGRF